MENDILDSEHPGNPSPCLKKLDLVWIHNGVNSEDSDHTLGGCTSLLVCIIGEHMSFCWVMIELIELLKLLQN